MTLLLRIDTASKRPALSPSIGTGSFSDNDFCVLLMSFPQDTKPCVPMLVSMQLYMYVHIFVSAVCMANARVCWAWSICIMLAGSHKAFIISVF